MKFEPIVHKASLIETPHHEYGVPVMRLTFIPKG